VMEKRTQLTARRNGTRITQHRPDIGWRRSSSSHIRSMSVHEWRQCVRRVRHVLVRGPFPHLSSLLLVLSCVSQSILSVDTHGTGVCDLVVTTMHSVEILTWDVSSAVDVLTSKLECIEEIRQLERAVQQMKLQPTK
jgi:hypothetical protein